jgi:hypothetical protein
MDVCIIDNCNKKAVGRGLCSKHYQRAQKYGTLNNFKTKRIINYGSNCSVEGCGNKAEKKGMCNNHYQIFRKYGDPTKQAFFYHGMSKWPEYGIWNTMRYRCDNPKSDMYYRYGGRGIKVCERWEKFENFIEDMGRRPTKKHQIDRIDNDGNYEPDNCRWIINCENYRNRSDTKLTHDIVDHIRSLEKPNQTELAKKYGVSQSTIWSVLNYKTWV